MKRKLIKCYLQNGPLKQIPIQIPFYFLEKVEIKVHSYTTNKTLNM